MTNKINLIFKNNNKMKARIKVINLNKLKKKNSQ